MDFIYPKIDPSRKLGGKLVMEKDGIISVINFSAIQQILGTNVKESIQDSVSLKKNEDQLALIQASKKSKKVKFLGLPLGDED